MLARDIITGQVFLWKHRGAGGFCAFAVLGSGFMCNADGDFILQKDEPNESSCCLEGLPVSPSFDSFLLQRDIEEAGQDSKGREDA